MGPGSRRAGGCTALACDAHARAAHPGPPASPGRAWQLREGRRSAPRPDFSRAPAPAGPATGPDRPPLARGVHGPPPLGGSYAAPPPPRDPRALPKFSDPLCPRARARHPHPLPHSAGPEVPRASLNPEISPCGRIRRPVTCSQHPDPRPGFPGARKPRARAARTPATQCPASTTPPKPVPLGSALQVPAAPPTSSWLPRRTAAR